MTDTASVETHPEYLALLAGVLAEPGDDTVRLVLADWLDEHGKGERAEFIRDGIEIARAEGSDIDIYVPPDGAAVDCSRGVRDRSGRIDVWADAIPEFRSRKVIVQIGGLPRGNEVERWAKVADFAPTEYLGSEGGRVRFAVTEDPAVSRLCEVMRRSVPLGIEECFRVRELMGGGFGTFPTVTRGFVDSVTCTAPLWLAHADALTARHPITSVTLATMPDTMKLYELARRHGFGESPGNRIERHIEILQAEWPGITFALPG